MTSAAPFGILPDGRPVTAHRIAAPGIRGTVLSWGAILQNLQVETPAGWRRVVIGYPRIEDYLEKSNYFGCIAGRCANRIADGRFSLDGVEHRLTLNEGGRTHLHGGRDGFDRRLWTVEAADEGGVTLALRSPDGEEGYPGTVEARVAYRAEPGRLVVTLTATTDAPTLVNLAGHSYFTLDGGETILDHRLTVFADAYTPVDERLIPTGAIAPVAGTPFDFRAPRPFRGPGETRSVDHNFVVARERAAEPRPMARVEGPTSGIVLEVWSTEPGVQVYNGSMMDTDRAATDGRVPAVNGGFCLEPQVFPDAVHNPGWPSAVLRPGETYRQVTEYRFAVPA